jgi:hypothetical protein
MSIKYMIDENLSKKNSKEKCHNDFYHLTRFRFDESKNKRVHFRMLLVMY